MLHSLLFSTLRDATFLIPQSLSPGVLKSTHPLRDATRPTGINNLTGGEKIVSLTREKARQWCEHNLDAETYISIWGTPEE